LLFFFAVLLPFVVNKDYHKPPHTAWWKFARTCTSTTYRSLLNFKVTVTCFCAFYVCMIPAGST